MEFKALGLEDKPLIDRYLHQDKTSISDTNFTNMFMWRHSREISYSIVNDQLIIQTRYPKQLPFIFYPIGQGDKKSTINALMNYYQSLGYPFEIHSLESYQLEEFLAYFPSAFEVIERRDRFEYIYHLPELIELSGRKYHKKKNHLNRFWQEYPQTQYESLRDSLIDEVVAVNNAWFDALPNPDDGLKYENLGINDALKYFDALKIQGGILRYEGEIIAFSFGEVLNSTTALIHIEKANIAYKGAYQAINQALLKNEFASLRYVNREEDLGIEGLRKAKLSYQPEFLLEKYDVRLKA
uniref:Phosphatidylglycerol lysyltransferase C-terminal domain-containing protein n=1 Tax=uncultured Helicobacter sp. TaxID=175537 RepID=A0A650EKJ6_9HELI|nr:hypothetical protein Helico4rc_2260 [uncultured Helicobacter sp.]